MNVDDLFNELADLGVCASGRRLWSQSSKDTNMIIKVWKRWPEYFVEHSDSALEIVRRYFTSKQDKEKLEENCIYLDRNIDVDLGSEESVFVVGLSSGIIRIKDWATVKLYCFNTSNLKIECGFHSYVNIECYNSSKLSVLSNKGTCTVYTYDDSIIDATMDSVNVVRKELKRGKVFNGQEVMLL